MASSVLDLRGLRKSHGARQLFDGVDLALQEGEKVGLIGRNGCGKSTLFRILAGEEGMDEGALAIRRGFRVGYLPQDPVMDDSVRILDTVARGVRDVAEALEAYDGVVACLAKGEGDIERLLARQASLAAELERRGGWELRHRAEVCLSRLGIGGWDRTVGQLSGGEKRRVALAQTLVSQPDILLLDEPTNHLDAATVLWLEETLYDFPGAALIVTHDRYFLDRVVDRMVEVSEDGLTSWEGGYTDYLEARMAREARMAVEEGKRRKLIEKELAWARRSPPARTGKQKARRARARGMADQQRQRDLGRGRDLDMRMTEAPRLGRTVLEIENLSHGYGDQDVLVGFTDRLLAGEKIGVVGPNGAGKSTLLKIIAGLEAPRGGRITLGENTRLAYFDQNRRLDPDLTVGQALGDREWVEMGGQRIHIRAYLDRFLFPPHVLDQRVSVLSGGERNRLLLARLFLESFNLLLLDEPTNDLDLDTLQVLEDLLESFGGCLLVVSHDRYFLDKLCSSLLVFREGGQVLRHHGNWDAWLAREEARLQAEASQASATGSAQGGWRAATGRAATGRGTDQQGPRRRSDREDRELRVLRERIDALEGEGANLEARLADPMIYAEGDGQVALEATRRYAEVTEALEQALERWLELEELDGR